MVGEHVQKILQGATEKSLMAYKRWLNMPPEIASHEYYSAANAKNWVVLEKFDEYLQDMIGKSTQKGKTLALDSRVKSTVIAKLDTSSSRHSETDIIEISDNSDSELHQPTQCISASGTQQEHNVINISDDSDSEQESHLAGSNLRPRTCTSTPSLPRCIPLLGSKKRPARADDGADICPSKRHSSNIDILKVLDSIDDEEPDYNADEEPAVGIPSTDVKPALQPSKSSADNVPRDGVGKIIVTRKRKVDAVEHLDSIPSRWPVPTLDTAYVLDFSKDARASANVDLPTRKQKVLDTFLKAEDQDSWGCGTNGSTSEDVKLTLLDNLPTCRSVHLCNRGLKCELFDMRLLEGHECTDAEDISKMKEIFKAEQH